MDAAKRSADTPQFVGATVAQGQPFGIKDGTTSVHLDGDAPGTSVLLPLACSETYDAGQRVLCMISSSGSAVLGPLGTPAKWTPYTPIWAASSGGASVGNGTLHGYYRLVGKSLTFRIHLVLGSTTSGGTGAWTFTLPTGLTSAAIGEQSVLTKYFTGTNATSGFAYLNASSSTLNPYAPQGSSALMVQASSFPSGTPGAWSAGGNLFIGGTIEIA